jgi:hypothetical protein
LRELQIDPDAVVTVRHWRPQWRPGRTGLMVAGAAGGLLLLIIGIVAVSTASAAPTRRGQSPGPQPAFTSVALGDITVEISAPVYRPVAIGERLVILHLRLHNTADARVRLLAGDLLLVDGHGALFPTAWSDANGSQHDGLLESNHTLVGLDPGAATELDLPFAVFGSGPFSLRYEHFGHNKQVDLPAPTLTSARKSEAIPSD